MYGKKEAKMTHGLAILTMLVLHLFCRTDTKSFSAFFWIDSNTPMFYWFGFFCEICMPLYSICAGYAFWVLYVGGKQSRSDRFKRVFALLKNYWIVVVLFSAIGLLVKNQNWVPHSWRDFVLNMLLIRRYNGAWWYLHSYVLLLLIPTSIIVEPIKKLRGWIVLVCLIIHVALYTLVKLHVIPDVSTVNSIKDWLLVEIPNLFKVLRYYWMGMFFATVKVIDKCDSRLRVFVSERRIRNIVLLFTFVVIFLLTNIVHKALLFFIISPVCFILFNLWEKNQTEERFFLFLGKHSTNIWFVHMFFYLYVFVDHVFIMKYPIPIFLYLLLLCICTSYLIHFIEKGIGLIVHSRKASIVGQ